MVIENLHIRPMVPFIYIDAIGKWISCDINTRRFLFKNIFTEYFSNDGSSLSQCMQYGSTLQVQLFIGVQCSFFQLYIILNQNTVAYAGTLIVVENKTSDCLLLKC